MKDRKKRQKIARQEVRAALRRRKRDEEREVRAAAFDLVLAGETAKSAAFKAAMRLAAQRREAGYRPIRTGDGTRL